MVQQLTNDIYTLPTWLPPGWKKIVDGRDGAKYSGTKGLTVIVSVGVEHDRNAWLHVSVAHPNRLPSYEELKFVKAHFVGRERSAIQFFPPESQHVNIHNYCLHLWSCLSGNVVPDFTRGGRSI